MANKLKAAAKARAVLRKKTKENMEARAKGMKRGSSAMSGLTGGTSVVAGQTRKGSAGGPVKRKKSKAKAADSGKIKETTREQRDRARGDYNVRVAADPSNPARLRPSERTPNKADIEMEKKKKGFFERLRGKSKPTKKPAKASAKGNVMRSPTMYKTSDYAKKAIKEDARRKAEEVRRMMSKKKKKD
tara:strand:- start:388 stop:951 length:564 start_codon:yes stop_codon:yes gene_type:complete